MATIIKKRKGGKDYYYIVESARVNGKPRIVNQIYLGTLEKIKNTHEQGKNLRIEKVKTLDFGALWLANEIEKKLGIVDIIDKTVGARKAQGISLGEYFLYAAMNRMIDATPKNSLPEWYRSTAIQYIRPVSVNSLDFQAYWRVWEKISEDQIKVIAKKLFDKVATLYPSDNGCFLFDTTNFYTFMGSKTKSDLAKRGKNKESKDWLRQIGMAFLVSRNSRLPLFYREYEGNTHDSKVFRNVLDEVCAAMKQYGQNDMTVIFDKGMNSEENIKHIDEVENIHFITTYSSSFSTELVDKSQSYLKPLETEKNKLLLENNKIDDIIKAWRTEGEYWGKLRTVVVTYNPRTASNQRYNFDRKLGLLQKKLFEIIHDFNTLEKISQTTAQSRYAKECERLHLPENLFNLEFEKTENGNRMSFSINDDQELKIINKMGINILITDHFDWTTEEIVEASLDRYQVEEAFKQSKDPDLVSMSLIWNWTDPKIRCHFLTCIIALTYLRIIELELAKANCKMTAKKVMENMVRLRTCLTYTNKNQKEEIGRFIEEPTEIQAKILKIFGYQISSGVIQPVIE